MMSKEKLYLLIKESRELKKLMIYVDKQKYNIEIHDIGVKVKLLNDLLEKGGDAILNNVKDKKIFIEKELKFLDEQQEGEENEKRKRKNILS